MGTSLLLVQKTVLVQKVLVLNIRTRDLDQTKAKTLIAKYYSPIPRLLLSFPWGHPCLMAPSRESVFIYLGASPTQSHLQTRTNSEVVFSRTQGSDLSL